MTVLTADAGVIRWSYHQAGSLQRCAIDRLEDGTLSLSATLVESDAYRLSQRPLVFEVTYARGVVTWPIQELQMMDGAVRARLGPRESRHESMSVCPA